MPNTPVRAAAEGMPAINRRRALSITGAGLAAALIPTAAPAAVSQLPELVAKHQTALKAFEDAIDVEWAAEAAYNKLPVMLSPGIMGTRYDMTGDSAEEIRNNLYRIVDKEAGIAGVTFKLTGGDPSVLKGWKRGMRARIRKSVEEWESRRADCGLAAAFDLREKYSEAERDALIELLAYRPVSPADARAKLEVLGPFNRKGHFDGMPGAIEALLESLLPEGEELPAAFYGIGYEHDEGGVS